MKTTIVRDMLERLDVIDLASSANIGDINVEYNFYAESLSSYSANYTTIGNLLIGSGTISSSIPFWRRTSVSGAFSRSLASSISAPAATPWNI
jgi:hypothetical protein